MVVAESRVKCPLLLAFARRSSVEGYSLGSLLEACMLGEVAQLEHRWCMSTDLLN